MPPHVEDPGSPFPVPPDVPPELTRPSARYRGLSALVAACLAGFAVFYAGLLVLLVDDLRLAAVLLQADSERAMIGVLFAPFALALLWMLVRAIWGVHRVPELPDAIEVTAEREPELFRVVHALADRVGAPRPHRVLLVPGVTAAVTYDASLWDVVFPSRKNLLIGLGLVNALTRGQLVAVLAHEFGHFSQSSMRLGRWVYVANRVIVGVAEKGGDMSVLARMSQGVDLRLALFVWAVTLFTWLVRTAIGGLFWVINLPQRALMREMELHADKVAVSLTGSDALIEALARLRAADLAFDQVASELASASHAKRFARDLYGLHARALERVGATHPELRLPADHERADPGRRLFAGEDTPPRMWATHPPGREREENAKHPYLSAPRDDRPAWSLFARADEARAELTAAFNRIHLAMPAGAAPVEDPGARGRLEGRRASIYAEDFVTASGADPEAWLGEIPRRSDEALVAALAARHDDGVVERLETRRRLGRELDLLLPIARGDVALEPHVRFRGESLSAADVPGLAEEVRDELVGVVRRIGEAHRDARRAAREVAERLGPEPARAHKEALALLHFLEHETLRLRALGIRFGETVRAAAAGGRTEQSLCSRLLDHHAELLSALARLAAVRADPPFPDGLGDALGGPPVARPDALSWSAPWVRSFAGQLEALGSGVQERTNVALEHLLDLEDRLEAAWLGGGDAPSPGTTGIPAHKAIALDPAAPLLALKVPRRVKVTATGSQAFQGVGRVAAAAAVFVVPAAVWLAEAHTRVVLYNGTGSELVVRLGAWPHALSPGERVETSSWLPWGRPASTEVRGEVVEEATLPWAPQVLYNAGRHGVLVSAEVVYSERGDLRGRPPELLGNPLVLATNARYVLEDPPRQLESSGNSWREHVADAVPHVTLGQLAATLDDEQRGAFFASMLRFDPPGPEHADAAEALRAVDPELAAELTEALVARWPDDLEAHRAWQSVRPRDAAMIERYRAMAEERPSATRWYLYGRLLEGEEASRAYAEALRLDPDHPRARLAMALNEAQEGRWDRVEPTLRLADLPAALGRTAAELALRARRVAGTRGLPDELAGAFEPGLEGFAEALRLEAAPDRLSMALALHPTFEPELRMVAGDLEGARRAGATTRKGARTPLLLALAGPTSGWPAALDALAPDQADGETLVLAAAAARATGRDPEPFLAAVDVGLEPTARALLAGGRPLDELARELDPFRRWVVYAGAATLAGDERPADLVERARGLSYPWQLPPW